MFTHIPNRLVYKPALTNKGKMQYLNLTLDKFQEDAIKAIDSGHSVVVSAPTGSGKTLIANYLIDEKLKENRKVIYTAPIKALSNQKYREFCALYGDYNIGLITGDTTINSSAPIIIMTTEIYRNMVIAKDKGVNDVHYVVFDEIHFINDVERGYVWEESIIFSPDDVRFLCLSATIPNAKEFAEWIQSIKHHSVLTIVHDHRIVPLKHMFFDTDLGMTSLKELHDMDSIPDYDHIVKGRRQRKPKTPPPNHIELVKSLSGNVPCLFFHFSRDACERKALELARKNLFPSSPEISRIVREKLDSQPPEINRISSARNLRQVLPLQIGFHHAGLLPVLKELVETLFGKGLIKVLYTTETFAVGINMPAKAVCFDSLKKFDGFSHRYLNTKEYFQMAGRAGRRGIDKEGLVVSMIFRPAFEYEKVKRLTSKDIEPISSQFKLGMNTVLNLIKLHSKEEIDVILQQSFLAYQKPKIDMRLRFQNHVKRLEKLGYLKNGILTEKGDFASKIYSDEILTTEIFATPLVHQLDEFEMLVVLAMIAYESREKNKFFKPLKVPELKRKLRPLFMVKRDRRYDSLYEMAAFAKTCFDSKSFFDLLELSSIPEGDLIRLFSQMLDRLRQVRRASFDTALSEKLDHLAEKIRLFLNEVKEI